MKLGDFFANAPHHRPINPRPVQFTAISRGPILPGGTSNPDGRPRAATIKAAFVFLGGEGTQQARYAARKHLRDLDEGREPNAGDFDLELTYQMLWRAIREYDEAEKKVGSEPMFPSVDNLRELVEVREANRVFSLYSDYVSDEHPEEVDDPTFRGAKDASPRMVARVSR
jgi:hypothetical protein